MAGILSIISTPIGNIKDISERAKSALIKADVILSENTNNSKKLMMLLGINYTLKKLISCNQHNEETRIAQAMKLIEENKKLVLISDAGTPTLSDPGGKIIEALVKQNYNIEVIPGPSALIAALMGAALITHRFIFLGFLPKKGAERKRILLNAKSLSMPLVIFESPLRVEKTLNELFELLGEQNVVVARELTKKFETFHRGVLGQALVPSFMAKGECVIVVECLGNTDCHPCRGEKLSSILDNEKHVIDSLGPRLREGDIGKNFTKTIVNQLINQRNIKKSEAYKIALKIKNDKK
jgi:16S rRNA (cytidine1402-2'-O)-methyltransferase